MGSRDIYSQGVTASLAMSRGRKIRVVSGEITFNTSYRDRSVVVAENDHVVKPKCQQYTLLNKMLHNFSK